MNGSLSTSISGLRNKLCLFVSTLRQNFGISGNALGKSLGLLVLALCIPGGIMGYHFLASAPRSPYGPYVCLPVSLQTFSHSDNGEEHNARFTVLRPEQHRQQPGLFAFEGGAIVSGDAFPDFSTGENYGFAAFAPPGRNRGLVNFTHGLVSIETTGGAKPLALLRHSPIPNMPAQPDPFQADLFTPTDYAEGDLPPLLYGEETDPDGHPARWTKPADALPDLMACSLVGNPASALHKLLRGAAFAPNTYFSGQANRYRALAQRYAEKYNLTSSMVLAIMHTESNFNPYAVSSRQAVGLMQIVPETAGNEVYRYLTGLPGTPNLDSLFSPEHNIKYGTIYLHLLNRRYFGNITNPRSRQLCTIAAYNGGPGAVLRLFDTDLEAAVERINTLTPDEIYKALTTDMPNAETRRYVEIVLSRMQGY